MSSSVVVSAVSLTGSSRNGAISSALDFRNGGNAFPPWPRHRQSRANRRRGSSATNGEREKLATARDEQGNLRHPEYQGEFPADDEGNEPWRPACECSKPSSWRNPASLPRTENASGSADSKITSSTN